MQSKLYRCGYCGCPTDKNGNPLQGDLFKRIVAIIEKYGDSHTELTHGECCVYEENNTDNMVEITRDMAIDAGDRNLEGQMIRWQ